MDKKDFKYIYGPVFSWRLGASLGIDPISTEEKICNFDCVYCQLGPTLHFDCARRVYVPTEDLLEEIRSLPPMPVDHLTFSGRGEPTLAKNLGEMIAGLKAFRIEKVAVITNAALMDRLDVQDDLLGADIVLAKMDAFDQASLQDVNRPCRELFYANILEGIRSFRVSYKGKLAIQVMLTGQNKDSAQAIAAELRGLGADEIELNTPLRPSPAQPLSEAELAAIKPFFEGLPVKTVYELRQQPLAPMDEEATKKRHGDYELPP